MPPAEIGHAAAYEAYRTWIHNSSIYEPMSGNTSQQRERLTGLAVAEGTTGISFLPSTTKRLSSASRLLSHAGRQMDPYASMGASEAAAATASLIFYQVGPTPLTS